ncbi:dipeptidase [Falsirhodobacter deserti]|uniref:dipeptidase n=1 Tax=Falsirhodobacter deserti TaxID=1365611 RepID=UPI000FE2D175|nr:dipeptidase [Falsirhodobacter deserti]
MNAIPVFDGHNDFLLRLQRAPKRREKIWLEGEGIGHLDLPRMLNGGFAGGLFAIYVPSPEAAGGRRMDEPPYDVPLPPEMSHAEALPYAMSMAGHLLWMQRVSGGAFRITRTAAQIENAMRDGAIAGVMHMEGAEAIDTDLDMLHVFHAMGLRSLGPVWSRPTAFGHGVPFRFPSGPDTGPGLTPAGRRLVHECNKLKIVIDLSHLNEAGFDDVARLSDAPLVASHSNAHAVTPSARNLTDRQLDVIRESCGMVGLNFATSFLREDGRRAPEMGWEPVLRHLDHLIARLGEDHVGFGSDFDGSTVPEGIGDVTGLPVLLDALRAHGYDDVLLEKLAWRNWVGVLHRSWGE